MRLSTAGEVAAGGLAGAISGLVLEVMMTQLGLQSAIVLLVPADSPVSGLVPYLLVAALFGIGFELLTARQRLSPGETVLWGLAYGALWWLIAVLTLLPILRGLPPEWTVVAAQAEFASLVCHLMFGASSALILVLLLQAPGANAATARVAGGTALRGALAGLAAVWFLDRRLSPTVILLGLMLGVGYGLLHPRHADGAGPALVRGAGYGFLLWVVMALTFVPAVQGAGLAWSVEQAREAFVTFPGYVLAGAVTAIVHRWFGTIRQFLFSDPASRSERDEGIGARGLQALGRGGLAGLAGGMLFALMMARVGYLREVAGLIDASSQAVGFVIHLMISVAIGITYGLAFRQQAYDPPSALGWGVAYGFFWWILGALTLLPILAGDRPQWAADAVAEAFPALVGHLVYGAILGVTFLVLEARSGPWWLTRTEREERRVARRQASMRGAPAVWALVIVIALTIPILLTPPVGP